MLNCWDADLTAQHLIDSTKEPECGHFDAQYSRHCPAKAQDYFFGVAPLAAIAREAATGCFEPERIQSDFLEWLREVAAH